MGKVQVIYPYFQREYGTWVFDDANKGLTQEPFVAGVPELIDDLVIDIPGSDAGFQLFFSDEPFEGAQRKLSWRREEDGGNWYLADDPPFEGWLCPALFRYFDKAPATIYVRAEELRKAVN
jgi:hypothetical protein